MKIVNYNDFIKMPEGTVFGFYEPCYSEGLFIKGESINDNSDFYLRSIDSIEICCDDSKDRINKLQELLENGKSYPLIFETECRDGLFDYDRLFSVFERYDVIHLIEVLLKTLKMKSGFYAA